MSEHQQPPRSEPLLTVKDLKPYLKLGRNKIYDMANRGEIPSIRIGSSVRFEPAKIRAWIEAQSAAPAQVLPLRRQGD